MRNDDDYRQTSRGEATGKFHAGEIDLEKDHDTDIGSSYSISNRVWSGELWQFRRVPPTSDAMPPALQSRGPAVLSLRPRRRPWRRGGIPKYPAQDTMPGSSKARIGRGYARTPGFEAARFGLESLNTDTWDNTMAAARERCRAQVAEDASTKLLGLLRKYRLGSFEDLSDPSAESSLQQLKAMMSESASEVAGTVDDIWHDADIPAGTRHEIASTLGVLRREGVIDDLDALADSDLHAGNDLGADMAMAAEDDDFALDGLVLALGDAGAVSDAGGGS